jgi:L-asparagine oxygenase
MLRIDLSDDVTLRLHKHLASQPGRLSELENLLPRLLQSSALLPFAGVKTLSRFRADPAAPAALLVTGVPLDRDLPATPLDASQAPYKTGTVSERALLLFAILLGEPVAYHAEKNGVVVQDVFPTMDQRDTPSNESSAVPLGFHTELVFSPTVPDRPFHVAAPDFVLLLGLRGAIDQSAATLFIESKDICARLSERQVQHLRSPNYRLVAPYSFTKGTEGDRPLSPPVPLLRGPAEAPALGFDSACGVTAESLEARDALRALLEACTDETIQQQVHLGPGDLLILDNKRCAHARTAFSARFDGHDRWLQRAYVRREIWPLPSASSGSFRVLA